MTNTWEDLLFGTTTPPAPQPQPATPTLATVIDLGDTEQTRRRRYAHQALADEANNVATAAEGTRNHTLNTAAFNLRRFVADNILTADEINHTLTDAALTNGLTINEIQATLRSAERGADAKPRDRPAVPPSTLPNQVQYVETINGHRPGQPAAGQPGNTDETAAEPITVFGNHPPRDAAEFLFDQEDTLIALWGDGDDILWAEGEALMIAGGMGLGKTTLAGQIIRAQLGLAPTDVLGLPVHPVNGPILYLAMDRPRQIRRSMLRQFDPTERDQISGKLLIRVGPPIADIALYPDLLAKMAEEAGAAVVYVDSLKDAAIGLSDDKVGAAYNRARQKVLADGRQICELHHNRKALSGPGGGSHSIADIYGSTWLTSGAGSVIMLTGEPGDPIIEFRHVKQPLNEVGPWRILNNPDAGQMSIEHQVDLIAYAQAAGHHGLTAHAAAGALFDTDKPNRAQVEKARYKLDRLANKGLLVRVDGMRGGASGTNAATWILPT